MIVELVGELLLEGLCHLTGRMLVRTLSLGRLHVGGFEPDGERRAADQPKRRWYTVVYRQEGRTYIDPDAVTFAGMLFWIAAIVVAFLAGRRFMT